MELFWLAHVLCLTYSCHNGENHVTRTTISTKPVDGDPADAAPEPRLSEDSRAFIGLKLRELYDDVVSEPVPDRFLQLLNKLGDDEDKPE